MSGAHDHEHEHGEEHGHTHGHGHGTDDPAHPHNAPLSDVQLRVKALESLLTEKGLVDPAALDVLIDTYETKVGPRNGARVVAKAWVDPEFKRRLLADATATLADLGYIGRQGEDMVVIENTPKVHNIVVCTLCSCYPWPVLGLPPVWYKSAPYRARAVLDPAASFARWASSWPTTSRCACGTRPPSSGISSCPSVPGAPTVSARSSWPTSSPATR